MLFTLNAPSAYLPFNAFANKFPGVCQWHKLFLLFVAESNSDFSKRRAIIVQSAQKEIKITTAHARRLPFFQINCFAPGRLWTKNPVCKRAFSRPRRQRQDIPLPGRNPAVLRESVRGSWPLILLAPKQATFQLERTVARSEQAAFQLERQFSPAVRFPATRDCTSFPSSGWRGSSLENCRSRRRNCSPTKAASWFCAPC